MTRWLNPRRAAVPVLVLFLAALSGCGYGKNDRVPVTGTVTFDGEPVEDGVITFVPQGGGGEVKKVGATIHGGKYALAADRGPLPGNYRVEVVWNKKTGKKVTTPGDTGTTIDETKQVIPPRFNRDTTLTAEIKPAANTVDYDLKSR
jgi:hypothetical protein